MLSRRREKHSLQNFTSVIALLFVLFYHMRWCAAAEVVQQAFLQVTALVEIESLPLVNVSRLVSLPSVQWILSLEEQAMEKDDVDSFTQEIPLHPDWNETLGSSIAWIPFPLCTAKSGHRPTRTLVITLLVQDVDERRVLARTLARVPRFLEGSNAGTVTKVDIRGRSVLIFESQPAEVGFWSANAIKILWGTFLAVCVWSYFQAAHEDANRVLRSPPRFERQLSFSPQVNDHSPHVEDEEVMVEGETDMTRLPLQEENSNSSETDDDSMMLPPNMIRRLPDERLSFEGGVEQLFEADAAVSRTLPPVISYHIPPRSPVLKQESDLSDIEDLFASEMSAEKVQNIEDAVLRGSRAFPVPQSFLHDGRHLSPTGALSLQKKSNSLVGGKHEDCIFGVQMYSGEIPQSDREKRGADSYITDEDYVQENSAVIHHGIQFTDQLVNGVERKPNNGGTITLLSPTFPECPPEVIHHITQTTSNGSLGRSNEANDTTPSLQRNELDTTPSLQRNELYELWKGAGEIKDEACRWHVIDRGDRDSPKLSTKANHLNPGGGASILSISSPTEDNVTRVQQGTGVVTFKDKSNAVKPMVLISHVSSLVRLETERVHNKNGDVFAECGQAKSRKSTAATYGKYSGIKHASGVECLRYYAEARQGNGGPAICEMSLETCQESDICNGKVDFQDKDVSGHIVDIALPEQGTDDARPCSAQLDTSNPGCNCVEESSTRDKLVFSFEGNADRVELANSNLETIKPFSEELISDIGKHSSPRPQLERVSVVKGIENMEQDDLQLSGCCGCHEKNSTTIFGNAGQKVDKRITHSGNLNATSGLCNGTSSDDTATPGSFEATNPNTHVITGSLSVSNRSAHNRASESATSIEPKILIFENTSGRISEHEPCPKSQLIACNPCAKELVPKHSGVDGSVADWQVMNDDFSYVSTLPPDSTTSVGDSGLRRMTRAAYADQEKEAGCSQPKLVQVYSEPSETRNSKIEKLLLSVAKDENASPELPSPVASDFVPSGARSPSSPTGKQGLDLQLGSQPLRHVHISDHTTNWSIPFEAEVLEGPPAEVGINKTRGMHRVTHYISGKAKSHMGGNSVIPSGSGELAGSKQRDGPLQTKVYDMTEVVAHDSDEEIRNSRAEKSRPRKGRDDPVLPDLVISKDVLLAAAAADKEIWTLSRSQELSTSLKKRQNVSEVIELTSSSVHPKRYAFGKSGKGVTLKSIVIPPFIGKNAFGKDLSPLSNKTNARHSSSRCTLDSAEKMPIHVLSSYCETQTPRLKRKRGARTKVLAHDDLKTMSALIATEIPVNSSAAKNVTGRKRHSLKRDKTVELHPTNDSTADESRRIDKSRGLRSKFTEESWLTELYGARERKRRRGDETSARK